MNPFMLCAYVLSQAGQGFANLGGALSAEPMPVKIALSLGIAVIVVPFFFVWFRNISDLKMEL